MSTNRSLVSQIYLSHTYSMHSPEQPKKYRQLCDKYVDPFVTNFSQTKKEHDKNF